ARLEDRLQVRVAARFLDAHDLVVDLRVPAGEERAAVDHNVDLVGALLHDPAHLLELRLERRLPGRKRGRDGRDLHAGGAGVRAARPARAPEPAPADALPVPPPHLIVRVAGTPDVAWFLESGRLAAESIGAALERAGTGIEAMTSVLDFGCGCGRVVRHWARCDVRVSGSDVSGAAIDWCRDNLPFARFETNGLSPPLAFPHESFDLAYALSVLTHLPEAIQHEWMDELRRVVRRDGFVLLTTHGERYLERLDADEQRRFR